MAGRRPVASKHWACCKRNQHQIAVEESSTTHLITQHAVDFIQANQSQPFCLYLPYEAPHNAYQGPRDPAIRSVGDAFDIAGERKDIKNAYREVDRRWREGRRSRAVRFEPRPGRTEQPDQRWTNLFGEPTCLI